MYLRLGNIPENQRVSATIQPTQNVRHDVYVRFKDEPKNRRAPGTI